MDDERISVRTAIIVWGIIICLFAVVYFVSKRDEKIEDNYKCAFPEPWLGFIAQKAEEIVLLTPVYKNPTSDFIRGKCIIIGGGKKVVFNRIINKQEILAEQSEVVFSRELSQRKMLAEQPEEVQSVVLFKREVTMDSTGYMWIPRGVSDIVYVGELTAMVIDIKNAEVTAIGSWQSLWGTESKSPAFGGNTESRVFSKLFMKADDWLLSLQSQVRISYT